MKKNILLLPFWFTLYAIGQTSVYHPFPDINAVWNIHANCGMAAAKADYSVILTGDTLINSQKYHKLTIPFVQSGSSTTITCGVIPGYQGAIRQDIPNRKVYFIPANSSAETLLYDFTMKVGEEVKGYIQTKINPKDIVQSIDSVLVGGNYRKRWKINSCYNIYIIEGIGSTHGLIESSPGCFTDQPYYTITCYRQNNQTLYPNTATNCQLITAVNSLAENAVEVKIFPNPSHGSFAIDFNKAVINEVRLTDLFGRVVFQQQQEGNKTGVNIENLPGGTYVLTLIDGQGRTTNRKIVNYPYTAR